MVNHSIITGNVDPGVMVDDSTLILTTTITETFTMYHTVKTELNCVPNPSPSQNSVDVGIASKDKNNTPIFVAIAIVVIGLLIVVTILIVGVILCHRYQKQRKPGTFSHLLNVTCKTAGEESE